MESDKATLCSSVIDFLLQEQYLLTAFELLHELQEDGCAEAATKLQHFFADTDMFPPDQLAQMHTLQGIDAQQLADERDSTAEKEALYEYELRLAREDIQKLQEKVERQAEALAGMPGLEDGVTVVEGHIGSPTIKKENLRVLGFLSDKERMDVNCAVKEYLVAAGYKITAMTFHDEVDQDLDTWQNEATRVPDALRRYFHAFLASTIDDRQERETLQQERDLLNQEKEVLEMEKASLTRGLGGCKTDLMEKDKQVQRLKESLEQALSELNEYRAEVTSLKLELESLLASGHGAPQKPEAAILVETRPSSTEANDSENAFESGTRASESSLSERGQLGVSLGTLEETPSVVEENSENVDEIRSGLAASDGVKTPSEGDEEVDADRATVLAAEEGNQPDGWKKGEERRESELETVRILADSLPKIIPYVLINHREELLPLIMCGIERHPDGSVRDSLTHNLFNLIKRPDEQQRRIIMDACVELSKNVGPIRTETELLPQCWEQIDHKYEERRLLVAQSCGELGQLVRPEMRTSLILSILQQLVGDPAPVVREAAAHNVMLLLPLFTSLDKYSKVEGLMFDLVCDPMGMVVETSLKELVPALVAWTKREKQPLSHFYRTLLSRLLTSAQRCPPVSGVQGSAEAHLRALGERERWNIDVLLRMLTDLLPEVRHAVIITCPLPDKMPEADPKTEDAFFSEDVVTCYASTNAEWSAFDWLTEDCLLALLQLGRMLPPREESLRTRLCKLVSSSREKIRNTPTLKERLTIEVYVSSMLVFSIQLLLSISECFGSSYLTMIVLPVFLTANGDNVDISHLSFKLSSRVNGLKPRTSTEERLAVLCVLPLLLAGVLGAPNMKEGGLALYLRELILQSSLKNGAWTSAYTPELIDAVRFLCTFQQQHAVIVGVLWELVMNSHAAVKISAAVLLKALVANVELKFAAQQVLPALVTLGSDPNLHVKHASIDAFGAVAQHFKDEGVVDKVKIQMDTFLEDGSHETTVAVVRALSVAIPLTSSSLRDYLLQKLVVLSGGLVQSTSMLRRREKADVFCEAIRALDATDLSQTSVSNLLVPTIQNLLKDPEALDPAHKEAVEVILRERTGGRLSDAIGKAVGTSMGSLFGEGGYLSRSNTGELSAEAPSPQAQAPLPQEESGLKRMMRMNFLGRS